MEFLIRRAMGKAQISFCVMPLISCLVMLLILHQLWWSSNYATIPLTLTKVNSQQLRTDQGDLASIGQHIFNAYFDTRSTLGGRKFVRIIAVLDTQAYSDKFICQFMHDRGDISFSTVARRSKIGAGMSHGNHYYQEFVLSCPIANDLTSAAFVFLQTEDGTHRSQVIRVRHNPLSLGEDNPKLIINCVSVTFGNPSEHRLIEWLEAQRLLKMDKVMLHLHHLKNKKFESIAKAYSAEGFLDTRWIRCPFCETGEEEHLGLLLMSPAINQCFYENLGRYQYTAVFDLDEIIVPQKHPDYPTMLNALSKMVNTSSFAFRNWYHFIELGIDPSVPEYLYMLQHPYRTREPSPEGYSTKSIHRSSCVAALHNHFSWEDVPKPDALIKFHHAPVELGVNEHYKKCHFDKNECEGLTRVKDRMDGSRLNLLIGRELTAASQQMMRKRLFN